MSAAALRDTNESSNKSLAEAELAKLAPPPVVFPKSITNCQNVAIACRDCSIKFWFTSNEQEFYIREIKHEDGTGPHFPVRCSQCRHKKKLRNDDVSALQVEVDDTSTVTIVKGTIVPVRLDQNPGSVSGMSNGKP